MRGRGATAFISTTKSDTHRILILNFYMSIGVPKTPSLYYCFYCDLPCSLCLTKRGTMKVKLRM